MTAGSAAPLLRGLESASRTLLAPVAHLQVPFMASPRHLNVKAAMDQWEINFHHYFRAGLCSPSHSFLVLSNDGQLATYTSNS